MQGFPFFFICKKSTAEGKPSAVLSMDAAQERVGPRTGYPTIWGALLSPLFNRHRSGDFATIFFQIFNIFFGLGRTQICFPEERMEESSVHGFHVPVIRGKTVTGRERLSNQAELRPFLRLQPPPCERLSFSKKPAQPLQNNFLVFLPYDDIMKVQTVLGLHKRWSPICRIYQNIRGPEP